MTEFPVDSEILKRFEMSLENLGDYLDQVQRQGLPTNVHYVRLRGRGKTSDMYIAIDHDKSITLDQIKQWLKLHGIM